MCNGQENEHVCNCLSFNYSGVVGGGKLKRLGREEDKKSYEEKLYLIK